ncbi:MAG: OmpA family protein [Flavobacteriales bacterium]
MKKSLLSIGIATLLFVGCVPARKYEDLKAKNEQCQKELAKFQTENEQFKTENTELSQMLATKKSELVTANEEMEGAKRKFLEKEQQYDKLKQLHDDILLRYNRLLANSSIENKTLSSKLDKSQKELQDKEDQLNILGKSLNELKVTLENKQNALELREQRVKELEELIAEKDAAVNALKDKVSKALLAFENKGLTVIQKNGKVYVSLEAKLLFASGSTKVGTEGKVAVIQLAKALETEAELEIIVEGHTDSDDLKSASHPKNNWELSVLRATSVVEIMTANSTINPKILSAAGRSKYNPLGEEKAANRRIEVILTPNLDKLFDIISN